MTVTRALRISTFSFLYSQNSKIDTYFLDLSKDIPGTMGTEAGLGGSYCPKFCKQPVCTCLSCGYSIGKTSEEEWLKYYRARRFISSVWTWLITRTDTPQYIARQTGLDWPVSCLPTLNGATRHAYVAISDLLNGQHFEKNLALGTKWHAWNPATLIYSTRVAGLCWVDNWERTRIWTSFLKSVKTLLLRAGVFTVSWFPFK